MNNYEFEEISKILASMIDFNDLKDMDYNQKFAILENNLFKIMENKKHILSKKDFKNIAKKYFDESFGFGPIESLIKDNNVTEIMINNYNEIYIEKEGVLSKTNIIFSDNNHVKNFIDKIISPLGLRIDESSPMVDAHLNDGSRINAVISPVSNKEIVISIRKFKSQLKTIKDIMAEGSLDEKTADFLNQSVAGKKNIIVSGGTSTGKTTMLNIISSFIPASERIITIEDTLELNLKIDNIVRLESRPSNLEGKGEITIRDLVKNSLRMRPDRIIVGEIRGIEAIDVLQAMNTGHPGSMTTAHANSPLDLISRLETMLIMSGLNLNPASARRIISSALDLIIHLERLKNGKRIISQISRVFNDKNKISDNFELEIVDMYRA